MKIPDVCPDANPRSLFDIAYFISWLVNQLNSFLFIFFITGYYKQDIHFMLQPPKWYTFNLFFNTSNQINLVCWITNIGRLKLTLKAEFCVRLGLCNTG